MKFKTLLAAVTVFGLWTFTMNLQAQVAQTVTAFNVTITHLNTLHDDGTTTTATTARTPRRITDLLQVLALDENAAGLYPNTNFPAGAKLVVDETGVFQVWDKTNGLLVVVSNILSFVNPTSNQVYSGKQNDNTGLGSPTVTSLSVGKLIYDDTAIAGGQDLEFFLQGMTKRTRTDVVNTGNGTYAETINSQLTDGTGDGTSNGDPFVVTGTVSASGKGTLPLLP